MAIDKSKATPRRSRRLRSTSDAGQARSLRAATPAPKAKSTRKTAKSTSRKKRQSAKTPSISSSAREPQSRTRLTEINADKVDSGLMDRVSLESGEIKWDNILVTMDSVRVIDLKEILKELGLKSSGSKAEIFERVTQALNKILSLKSIRFNLSSQMDNAFESENVEAKSEQTPTRKGKRRSSSKSTRKRDEDSNKSVSSDPLAWRGKLVTTYKKLDLIEELKKRSLPIYGNKNELIARLIAFDEENVDLQESSHILPSSVKVIKPTLPSRKAKTTKTNSNKPTKEAKNKVTDAPEENRNGVVSPAAKSAKPQSEYISSTLLSTPTIIQKSARSSEKRREAEMKESSKGSKMPLPRKVPSFLTRERNSNSNPVVSTLFSSPMAPSAIKDVRKSTLEKADVVAFKKIHMQRETQTSIGSELDSAEEDGFFSAEEDEDAAVTSTTHVVSQASKPPEPDLSLSVESAPKVESPVVISQKLGESGHRIDPGSKLLSEGEAIEDRIVSKEAEAIVITSNHGEKNGNLTPAKRKADSEMSLEDIVSELSRKGISAADFDRYNEMLLSMVDWSTA